jgi:hypothetical protein
MYSYHDKIELNNSVIVPHIFKQMIPINNNVIMSVYCDNNNAKKSKKLLSEITNIQKYVGLGGRLHHLLVSTRRVVENA